VAADDDALARLQNGIDIVHGNLWLKKLGVRFAARRV
jgi:hypothetical protein